MTEKLTFEVLKTHLFGAADILRKQLNPEEYRPVTMAVLFIKKLHDEYESNVEKLKAKGKSDNEARKAFNHTFVVPSDANWDELFGTTKSIGSKLNKIARRIEDENKRLTGVLTASKFDDKNNFPDNIMEELLIHFNKHNLSNDNLVKPDIFGDAYEYLLAEFASETKKKGGQFYTPHEVVRLLVLLTKPKEGMRICDPTCGSGGMLVQSWSFVKEKKGNPDNITLHGQESNYSTVGMSKMNLVLHGVSDFRIEHGDTLDNPLLQEDGKLLSYDRVLANFPFSENWKAQGKENDPYDRFRLGIPPAKDKADFAFIQHMYSTLNDKGQAAIISSQGVLFRGSTEAAIRQGLYDEDAVEAIIALPTKLFFGTGIPGCILLLNKNKPKERKGKILFVYAAKDYQEEKNRNILREKDLKKIVSAISDFKDIDRYCHVAEKDEIEENEYNFNVPRYVDISEPEEPIDIQDTINEIKKLDKEREKLETKVNADLKELGFKV
jgi:type I restriction enzyme M protein